MATVQRNTPRAPSAEAPSPTALMAAVSESFDVFDGRGRKITLKKPPFFAQFEIIKALGVDAQNPPYVQMVMPIIFVIAIDGDAVPMPSNAMQIKALVQRLDEDGYLAVTKGLNEHFADAESEPDKEMQKN